MPNSPAHISIPDSVDAVDRIRLKAPAQLPPRAELTLKARESGNDLRPRPAGRSDALARRLATFPGLVVPGPTWFDGELRLPIEPLYLEHAYGDLGLLRDLAEDGARAAAAVDAEVIVGAETAGIPLSTAISMVSGIPSAFVRKAGYAGHVDDEPPTRGASVADRRALFVDDPIWRGDSLAGFCSGIRSAGGELVGAYCMVDMRHLAPDRWLAGGAPRGVSALRTHRLLRRPRPRHRGGDPEHRAPSRDRQLHRRRLVARRSALGGLGGPMKPAASRATYLLLSAGSGLIELGVPALTIWMDESWTVTLVTGLAYQLGTPLAAVLTTRIRLVLGCFVAAGLFLTYGAVASPPVVWIGSMLVAAVVQAGRSAVKSGSGVSTALKRSARVVGFCLAGWASVPLITSASFAVGVIAAAGVHAPGPARRPTTNWHPGRWRVLMLVHQIHYFVYAYTMVVVLAALGGAPPEALGLIFSAGWVTYIVAPRLFRWAGDRVVVVVVVGHLTVALLLLAMGEVEGVVPLTTLWVLTGFGGGTVFAVRSICLRHGEDEATIDFWEDAGHVAGAALAVPLAMAVGDPSVTLVGGALAAASVALMVAVLEPRPGAGAAGAPAVKQGSISK